jgi:ATP-dependent DNA helicase RecQ
MESSDRNLILSILADYEETIARLVLFSLKEMPFPLGVKKTIDFLKGNRSSFVINNELNKLFTFSSLPGFTRDQLSDVIDILINQEFIAVEQITVNDEEYPVLKITEKGTTYLENPRDAEFVLLDVLMDKDVPEISEDDQDLYYKLKLARRQLAEEYDIPAFMVCSDLVLRSICNNKPMEPEELEKVKGVGPKFMELYSKQFLYVIRQYITREKSS